MLLTLLDNRFVLVRDDHHCSDPGWVWYIRLLNAVYFTMIKLLNGGWCQTGSQPGALSVYRNLVHRQPLTQWKAGPPLAPICPPQQPVEERTQDD